ncbi:hypothetical protein B0H67DRAFT_679806 [Lasiosphaeris hirsuta]|uniref:Uncharacterized protein n=1 Tax=Lasiosphaeris hirsuta TaxID=260670 RepID=A0AA40AY66_9PEZI|nr:hypothetical protein B0H67DRAFT_679806 [Lasiosphaeris hirsuta]
MCVFLPKRVALPNGASAVVTRRPSRGSARARRRAPVQTDRVCSVSSKRAATRSPNRTVVVHHSTGAPHFSSHRHDQYFQRGWGWASGACACRACWTWSLARAHRQRFTVLLVHGRQFYGILYPRVPVAREYYRHGTDTQHVRRTKVASCTRGR